MERRAYPLRRKPSTGKVAVSTLGKRFDAKDIVVTTRASRDAKIYFCSRTAAQAKSRRDSRDALSCTPIIHHTVTIDVRACTIFFVLGFSIDRSEVRGR